MSECPRAAYAFEGHDWSVTGDRVRRCRKCGATESYGRMGECYNGHDWQPDGAVYLRCRRCGARTERDPTGATGW